MKPNIVFSILLILIFLFSSKQVLAEKLEENPPVSQIEAKKLDSKARILAEYLATYNSPLQNHAQDFIDAAEAFNLDWRLLPSIAGVESTFGKYIPGGYNAWGWGVYGTQAIYFSSWRDGIFTVGKGLRENYLNKGLNDPYSINKVYAASPTWGSKVSYFMQDLENFAGKFQLDKFESVQIGQSPKIAAVSGQLAIR